jgi:hypothetical protein
MDGSRFDAWTRRRFSFAAGGLAATLWGLLALEDTAAKKKKTKKKRCKKLSQPCKQGGKRKCCGELRCRTTSLNAGIHTFCCKTEGKPCQNESECCDPLLCCGPAGFEVCSSDCKA